MSSNRNPKDLHQILSDSDQDMSDMQSNLAKLKALSADDKTENAMMRSRVDEQCQLIMSLKQRADDTSGRIHTLERINEELINFRDSATDQLQHEIRKYNILDARFSDLSSNHEEMIKFKDEYKRMNKELREENTRLKEDNAKLFSKTIKEKEAKIDELDQKLFTLRDQYRALETKQRKTAQDFTCREDGLKQKLNILQDQYEGEMKHIQSKLNDAEERLKAANYKLQGQIEGHKKAETDSIGKLALLLKEKEEMLDLAMERGKLVQKEQTENKKLQKKITAMEKSVRDMEDRFEREAAAVSANLQVQKLKGEVEQGQDKYNDTIKEFEAFKRHSNSLLQKEKELNERLRHLVG